MFIKKDYSYIKQSDSLLIEKGFGEMNVHSIHFNRHYSEEEKENNLKRSKSMTAEEWSKHCDEVSRSFDAPLKEILSQFIGKYVIHQISEETSTLSHFNSDWDLYFNSNRGFNDKDYMDSFTFTFNKRRTPKENMHLLEEVISIVKELEYPNIYCRIQFTASIDIEKVENEVNNRQKDFLGVMVNYNNHIGKFKIVDNSDKYTHYGFFNKGAKTMYYHIKTKDILVYLIQMDMLDSTDSKEKEYRCTKCGCEFKHREITAEDEDGRDLCPACTHPLSENDML